MYALIAFVKSNMILIFVGLPCYNFSFFDLLEIYSNLKCDVCISVSISYITQLLTKECLRYFLISIVLLHGNMNFGFTEVKIFFRNQKNTSQYPHYIFYTPAFRIIYASIYIYVL